MKIHIVQKGDSLWKIAKKYGVNFEQLKKTNSQLSNPDMLMPGMKIKIPETSSSPKKENDTKVNFGVKEAPVQPMTQAKPQALKQPAVKEMPTQYPEKESVKEMPKMPYVAPKETVKPVIPEIDINNYYLMNMTKMEVPPPMPIYKEKPKKEEPVILKEKPIKEMPKEKPTKEMPKEEPPEPMPLPVPLPTPQYEYCQPVVPYYNPCCYPYMYNPCYPYHMTYMPHPCMMMPSMPSHSPMMNMQGTDVMAESYHYEQEMMDLSPSSHGQMQQGAMPQQMYMPQSYMMMPYQPGMSASGYGQYPQSYGMMEHDDMMQTQEDEYADYSGGAYAPFDGYMPQCGFTPASSAQGQETYYQPMNQSANQYSDSMMQQMQGQNMQSQSMQGQNMQNQGMQGQNMLSQSMQNQNMQNQNVQNPYAAQPTPYQEVSGMQGSAESVPFYNPHASQMIPRINPAAFDMPGADDEESSEQEG